MNRCVECGYKGELKPEDVKLELAGVAIVDGTKYTCPQCNEEFSGFSKMEELFKRVAKELASAKRRLRPAELVWMRKYLGFSSTDLAAYLSVARETVSRWENGRNEIPVSTERLLRMMSRLGPHIESYGTPNDLLGDSEEQMALHLNSTGSWVRA